MKTKIFIGTPMYGGQCYGLYMSSIMNLTAHLTSLGQAWEFRFIYNDALITRARNFLVHEFLQTDSTHLLFVDSDIQFNALDVPRMVAADKGIVCGAYPCKNIRWDRVKDLVDARVPANELSKYASDYVHNGTDITIGGNDLKEVGNAGTGFMLIKREVFEQLSAGVPDYTCTEYNRFPGEKIKLFFDTSVDEKHHQYLSEDYHFCKLWRDIGGKTYIAEWVRLNHIGTYSFG